MHRSLAAAAVAAFVLLGGHAAFASSGGSVAASVPPFIQAATLLGAANPSQKIHIVIFLAYPNHAAVDQFAAAVNNPSSPEYGDFLTPAQFSSAYGPSPRSYTMVEYALQGGGFKIVQTYADDKVIDAVGTVAQANALFDTVIDYYSFKNVTYYANSVPALLPSVFGGLVMAVSGFNDFVQRYGTPLGSSLPPGPDGFGPLDIQAAYNEPEHMNAKWNGSGATVAIETAYDYLDSDLSAYWSEYGVSRTGSVTRVLVDDPVNQGLPAPGQSDETTLDVEQSTSNAPGANVEVFEASDPLNATFDDVYAAVVNDPHADVVTTSWGSCEAGADATEVAADNDLFEQAAAEGQTMFAATGDNGTKDCGTNNPPDGLPGEPNPTNIDFPSDSPWVAAAGGTTLVLNSSRGIKSETAWSDSGGGVSGFFSLPPYQNGVAGLASTSMRNTPDVALDADPNTPYSLYYFGTWALPVGGTSAVAPNMAAIFAQCDDYYHHRLGLAQTGLYNGFVAGTYPGKTWHDITSGSNGDFAAHAGYDNVTGVGSLNANKFMQQIPPTKGHAKL